MGPSAAPLGPVTAAWILRRRRRATFIAGLTLIVHHVFAIVRFAPARIGGRWYVLADDDVMITLRYARNLAAGDGLVLNPGEHVEGFTNPLLVVVGAALHRLHVPAPFLPLALDLLNMGLSLCILHMLFGFWGKEPEDRLAGLIAGALYALGPQHLFFAHAGFEVYLQSAILLYCVSRLGRLPWRCALLLGLLPLTHGTAQVAWLVLCGAQLVVPGSATWTARLGRLAISVTPIAAYEVFRLRYYGEALPNTYWLKVGASSLAGGLVYVRGWMVLVLPMVVLAAHPILGAVRAASHAIRSVSTPDERTVRSIVVLTVLAAHVAAVIALGGDYFPQARFLFPCTVLLAPMAGRGAVLLVSAHERASSRRKPLVAAGAALVALGALAGPFLGYVRIGDDLASVRRWNIQHVAMGLALKANTRADAVIAVFGLGAVSYYSERRCIDMLGKADPHIARTLPHPKRRLAHNKSDFTYVLTRSPDFIEMRRTPEELTDVSGLTERSLYSPHGHTDELGLHPVFRAGYLPHPVQDTHGRFAQLYARSPDRTSWDLPDSPMTVTSEL